MHGLMFIVHKRTEGCYVNGRFWWPQRAGHSLVCGEQRLTLAVSCSGVIGPSAQVTR